MDLEFPHLQFSSRDVIMVASASPELQCPRNATTETHQKRELSECFATAYMCGAIPISRTRARMQKHVRFLADSTGTKDALVVISRSAHHEDLSNVWYTRQDYRAFRDASNSLALAFELGVLDRFDPEEVCLRGLEANLSKDHLDARLASRGTLIEFILRTQEAQKGHGMRDPELIRGLSIVLSKDACEDALKLAAYDLEEANEVLGHHEAHDCLISGETASL
jgi:hypothetical protein